MSLRILVVASRDPGGRQSGRKSVLRTIVSSLVDLGHEVEVAALSAPGDSGIPGLDVPVHWLGRPGLGRVAANVASGVLPGRLSLNESLFTSPQVRRAVRQLAATGSFDVVVADMLRSFPAAEAAGLPLVLDLDDLLSERYRGLRGGPVNGRELLGYYAEGLPPLLVRGAGVVIGRILAVEARLLERREREAAARADVVTLVAEDEARRFADRTGSPVLAAPMALPVPPGGAVTAGRRAAVFLGGLDYRPNLEAVRWYVDEIQPQLRQRGLDVPLVVVGHHDDEHRRLLADADVVLLGYMEDLAPALRDHFLMVAPIRSGTGVKTKVVEGALHGLPLVATPAAVAGTGLEDGVHAWVADEPEDFARAVAEAAEDDGERTVRAERARTLVEQRFGPDTLRTRWAEILGLAIAAPRRDGVRRLRVLFYNDYPMDQAMAEWKRGEYPGQHLFGVTHLHRHGVDVEILPFGRNSRLRDLLYGPAGDPHQQLRVLWRALTGDFDVIYAAGSYNSSLLAVLRRLRILRLPLVGTVHHLARGPLRHPVIYRAAFGGHDRLLCMSEELRDEAVGVMGYPAERATTVGWAVDLDLYRPAWPPERPPGPPIVLSAGKTKRDYQTLADALSGTACRLEIYCSADSAPDTTGLADNVVVRFDPGDRGQAAALTFPELLARYRSCDAVAIPLPASEMKGTTGLTSLLEALAMGRGVLMTTNSYLDLEGLGVGAHVPPDDRAGWRAAVDRLVVRQGAAEAMGERARALCEDRFSLDDYATRVAAALWSAAQGRTRPA